MLRFSVNRSWAFVLTLCLFTTCFFLVTAQLPSVASADSGSFRVPADDQPPGAVARRSGRADGPRRRHDRHELSVVRSGSNQVVSQSGARPVGDGAVPSSVVMDRVRLFLLGLRSLYLRF